MAYPAASVISNSSASASTFNATMPTHQTNDVLVAFVTQDTGTTGATATGWTVIGSPAANLTQRTTVLYKVAASSSETLSLSGTNSTWSVSVIAVRGADTSTPIHASSKYDMPSNAYTCASPSLTTTNNDTILLYGWGYRSPSGFVPYTNNIMNLTKQVSSLSTRQQAVGYKNMRTAGSIPSVTMNTDVASRGGTSWVIAINDDGSGQFAPDISSSYAMLSKYGAYGAGDGVTTAITANKMSTTSISSISGISVSSTAASQVASDTFSLSPYGLATRLVFSEAAPSGLVVGTWHAPPVADFSDGLVSFQWGYAYAAGDGPNGIMVGFEDNSGNWEVFRLGPADGSMTATSTSGDLYSSVIAVGQQTPFASSGTINWTNITKIIYASDRSGSASGARLYLKDAILHKTTAIVGGASVAPVSPKTVAAVLEGWGSKYLQGTQGVGQILNKLNLQIGDGTNKTYFDASSTAYELPIPYADNINARFWQVPDLSVNYVIKASANDTIKFTTCLLATSTKQTFKIDSGSSTSASYDFTGAVFSGWQVTGKAGVTFNSAVFDSCYLIDLDGGGLDSSTVTKSLNSVAVKTSDPEAITDCTFISAGTGHAIELTTPGSYDFTGNTFTGYGANGTSDAAIYNNSGGAVELIIPAGDDTPTVKNGAGASTTITQPTDNQSVTISGATAGSRIQIYDLTSDTELYNGTPTFPYTWTDASPYAADREIRLRVAYVNGTSAKQFIDTVIGTSTNAVPALSYLVNQSNDTVYNTNAVDGSTITTVTIDDNNLLVEVDTGSISIKDIYAYEMYWLFTSTGIADEGKAIVATDVANYAIYGFKLKNVTSPSVPLTITGGWVTDGDTGVAIDIVDTSGGTIFLAPDHVVAYATGSGVTPSDVNDIASAVWDETASSHTTTGTTGKYLTDARKQAKIAANK